jgi:hypothetical protein
MNRATKKFLDVAAKYRLLIVSIGIKTPLVKSTEYWPFPHQNSVFADGETKDGRPRIWSVCEEAGIDSSCGNSGQSQLPHDHALEIGVYRRHHQTWKKIA